MAGEMAQQLRVLAALPEDPDLISRNHMVVHRHLQLQSQDLMPPSDIHTVHRHECGQTTLHVK